MGSTEYYKNYAIENGIKVRYRKMNKKEREEYKRLAKAREDEIVRAFLNPGMPLGTCISSH